MGQDESAFGRRGEVDLTTGLLMIFKCFEICPPLSLHFGLSKLLSHFSLAKTVNPTNQVFTEGPGFPCLGMERSVTPFFRQWDFIASKLFRKFS